MLHLSYCPVPIDTDFLRTNQKGETGSNAGNSLVLVIVVYLSLVAYLISAT